MGWRRICCTFVLGLLLAPFLCARTVDTPSDTTALMNTLREYLANVDRLSPEAATAECDFIIASVADSTLRSDVATRVYRHFRKSKYMGAENVAVHVYDKWFATFRTVFPSLEELDEAEFYAFVNRASLLGRKAVPLEFVSEDGTMVTIPSSGSRKKRPSIVYFYSTGCPKCLYTSLKIKDLLNKGHYKANVFAIYTGDDMQQWKEYRSRELKLRSNCRTRVWHLMGGDTDFVIPYGVIQTPRLLLIDADGVIIGRGLDADALKTLLETPSRRPL